MWPSPQDTAGKYSRGACFVPDSLLHEALKNSDSSHPEAKGRLLSQPCWAQLQVQAWRGETRGQAGQVNGHGDSRRWPFTGRSPHIGNRRGHRPSWKLCGHKCWARFLCGCGGGRGLRSDTSTLPLLPAPHPGAQPQPQRPGLRFQKG